VAVLGPCKPPACWAKGHAHFSDADSVSSFTQVSVEINPMPRWPWSGKASGASEPAQRRNA
jgi:hypothetical protein